MTPAEWYLKLNDEPSKARYALLKSIPADSEFWLSAHHGLRHLVPYPVEYALRDPYQYGPGVPEGTFSKILEGMVNLVLDEVSTVRAISAFSAYCTESEWLHWYRPVLEKRLRLPVTITEFNKACPKKYRITDAPMLTTFIPVNQAGGLPQSGVIEPYNDGERLLVLMRGKTTYVFLEDGTPVHRWLPQAVDRFRRDEGVVLELIKDASTDKFFARDVILWGQYLNATMCPDVLVRLRTLEKVLAGQDAIEVVDYYHHDGTANPREDIAMALQCGYESLVFRASGVGYWKDSQSILVHPKRKSILTCTRVDEGPEDSKYAGRTEYLWGTGRMNNKNFESPVFHGLTFSDRETILKGRDRYIGQRFEVLSCGLDPNDKLIFPILQQWKQPK